MKVAQPWRLDGDAHPRVIAADRDREAEARVDEIAALEGEQGDLLAECPAHVAGDHGEVALSRTRDSEADAGEHDGADLLVPVPVEGAVPERLEGVARVRIPAGERGAGEERVKT